MGYMEDYMPKDIKDLRRMIKEAKTIRLVATIEIGNGENYWMETTVSKKTITDFLRGLDGNRTYAKDGMPSGMEPTYDPDTKILTLVS